jgi:uncharacterized membrane protein
MKTILTNALIVLAIAITAFYVTPYLIMLITSGIVQILVTAGLIFLIVKTIIKPDLSDKNRYR